MGAGDYHDRLEWRKRVPGGRDSFGQPVDTYPSKGFLWGVVENVQGNRTGEKEQQREQLSATIRLRNYPAVKAGDQLADGDGGVWTVGSVVAGDNETTCEVTSPTWTVGGAKQ